MAAAAPTILTWLTFAAIVAMIVAYALERWAVEVVSLMALVGWLVLFWAVPMLTGTQSPLGPDALLAGLANQALITVLALLVVGQGLFHTDALEKPTTLLARLGGRTGMGAIYLVLVAAMIASAFVNDTPIVVMFLPIITAIAAGTRRGRLQDADAAVLRRPPRRHDDAHRHLDQPACRRRRREGRGPEDRLLRFHRSRGGHGAGRLLLRRLRAAQDPQGAHRHGRRDHRRFRQAVHRPDRHRLRPSAGRHQGGRRHVPGAQGHDRAAGPAARASLPAALRGL